MDDSQKETRVELSKDSGNQNLSKESIWTHWKNIPIPLGFVIIIVGIIVGTIWPISNFLGKTINNFDKLEQNIELINKRSELIDDLSKRVKIMEARLSDHLNQNQK